MAATWDVIREHIETNELSLPMPTIESHVRALFGVPIEQRGVAWETFLKNRDHRVHLVAKEIEGFVENFKALPTNAEVVSTTDVDESSLPGAEAAIDFGDIPLAKTPEPDVPQETKVPVPDKERIGAGPDFTRPPEVMEAIERIARVCGNQWRTALLDSMRIPNDSVLEWAKQSEDHIHEVSRLIHGDHKYGVLNAIRFVTKKMDEKSRLGFINERCMAAGGKMTFEIENFLYVVKDMTKT
jgi:hypothetical protein